ncbi:DUF5986 family protein [Salicibibacter kimchii]|uniref:Uncharacterized protein n=1 Tax=Salicibibacter kimchii TaxID=2099786 RepID=A0A345BWE9_9BACI|nr:DUF5986 family protein [Salicibibacter kimchii]AXF55280.1 hypothetical protein DT065_04090 [Salicibibacter kimchii]
MNLINFEEPNYTEAMVRAFSDNVQPTLYEIQSYHGFSSTFNSRHFAAWDKRFSRLDLLENDFQELEGISAKRGIWGFSMLLDNKRKTLFLFTKEKNLESVRRKFGKDKLHYFHALLLKNRHLDTYVSPSEGDPFQFSLFDEGIERYNDRRRLEAIDIIGDDYDRFDQVVILTLAEENGKATKVEAGIFSSEFRLIQSVDLSDYIKPDFEDASVVGFNDASNPGNKQIPNLKKEYTPKEKQIVSTRKRNAEKDRG